MLKVIDDSILYVLLLAQVFNSIYLGIGCYVEGTVKLGTFVFSIAVVLFVARLTVIDYIDTYGGKND